MFGGCSAIARHGGRMSSGLGRIPTNNKIYVLDADTLSWSKPNVAGVTPFPRYRHASAIAGSTVSAVYLLWPYLLSQARLSPRWRHCP